MRGEKQPWLETQIEVVTNTCGGFGLSVTGNGLYLWWYDIRISLTMISGLAILMTLLSIVRQIILRRFFEHVRVHRWIPRLRTWFTSTGGTSG